MMYSRPLRLTTLQWAHRFLIEAETLIACSLINSLRTLGSQPNVKLYLYFC